MSLPYSSYDYEATLPAQSDSAALHYYLSSQDAALSLDSSLQATPLLSTSLPNTTLAFGQSAVMDSMMISQSLGESFGNVEPHPAMMSASSAPALTQSPTLSWVSVSRETSPIHEHTSVAHSRSAYRAIKRRFGSGTGRYGGAKARGTRGSNGSNESTGDSTGRSTPKPYTKSTSQIDNGDDELTSSDASASQTSVGAALVKHKQHSRQGKNKDRPTSFACDSPGCGKIFSRAYNLTSHMKTHSAERPFLCGSCPLAFARRHDRERHVRLHTGDKPYSCESCGCGFMRNDALHRHQRICAQSSPALMALLQQQQHQLQHQQPHLPIITGYEGLFPSSE
ncbi:hypothetical protein BGZ99_003605 [Dissophora globulifera]|uniref:C2H2-type domain-containing protein n=1 Tax=Dissophora globulifera TaxID=979702 RepID=A0A9P6RKR7_9FUNG|nr:hypothetical protein BGZ99_003605 [Dissophora globulifera]